MINGFQKEIRNKVLGFWSHMQIVPFSLSSSLQEQAIYKYQDFYTDSSIIPEARHIQVTALKGGLLKTDEDFEGIILRGVGNDFDWTNLKPYLKEGDIIKNDTSVGRKDILISSPTAKRLQVGVGDKVTVTFMGKSIRNRPFRICGIYETGLEEFDARYAMTDISVIQELNNWGPDSVGGFEVFLKEDNLFKSRDKSYFITLFGGLLSEEMLMDMRKDPLDELTDDVYTRINNPHLDIENVKYRAPGIFDWLDLQTMNELIILILMIVVAAINMVTALLILILERTNMIGIMKALGAANFSIRRVFLYYSAVIIGVGLLFGNVVGLGVCLVQKHFHLIKLPQESYYLSYAPVELNWWWVLALNAGTIAITLVLLIVPSMLVSRISPVKAIRFE